MSVTLRPGRPEDAERCGGICFEAFRAVAEQHNFPLEFPSRDAAVGVIAFLLSRPDVYSVVAESSGRVIGSNFLSEGIPIAGIGPISVDPAAQNSANLGYTRPTNNAGGLEAGMTNGQPLVIRAAKKPISTLRRPLESVNLDTKQPEAASYERSDVCAVPAASVIVENVVAFEVASALVDKFGGDSLTEMKARWELFQQMARQR